MPAIRILDDEVVAKIRAGEVIDRPAAVAKELIENALDAGSRLIAVQTASSPERSIRIQDDGHGMSREDALLSVRRHATSKLESAEDLVAMRTLGFRGEALASIAEVSRLTLSTRSAEELSGSQIEVLGGAVISVSGIGRAVGTTVVVEDLFFNTPARLRFLRSRESESRVLSSGGRSSTGAGPRRARPRSRERPRASACGGSWARRRWRARAGSTRCSP